MDQQNTPPTPNQNNYDKNIGLPPERLPIMENKKIITHTMKDDLAQAQSQGGKAANDESLSAQNPFSANIPPPPLPPASDKAQLNQDTFREPIEDLPMGRDQDIPIPGMSDQNQAHEQFKIQIPQKRRSVNAATIILIVILTVLIAGGGFGYYWFFIKESGATTPTNQEPTPPAPAPAPQPIIPTPAPEPQPIPIQPEPTPPPPPPLATSTAPIATTTVPIIATSTPPITKPTPPPVITEPTKPPAVLSLDQDIVIEIPKIDKTAALAKIKSENSKISKVKASVRYAFKLSNDKEKRFLTAQETAQMLVLTLSQEFWQLSDGFDFVSYKNGKSMRYGLIAKVKTGKDQFKIFTGKWEASILDDLNTLYIDKAYAKPKSVVFSENTYLDFYKRFINMPLPDISFDYAISDKYFITATSKEMIYAVLDRTNTSLSAISAEKPKTSNPKESYLVMKKEADNIKSYADLEAYTLKYGSKEQIAKLEANKKQIDALSQLFKDQIVALAKGPLSTEITTVQETKNGNTAKLNIQTTKPGLTGVVTLVLEDDQWKLELESWEQK